MWAYCCLSNTVKNECSFPSDKQFGQAFFPAARSASHSSRVYCKIVDLKKQVGRQATQARFLTTANPILFSLLTPKLILFGLLMPTQSYFVCWRQSNHIPVRQPPTWSYSGLPVIKPLLLWMKLLLWLKFVIFLLRHHSSMARAVDKSHVMSGPLVCEVDPWVRQSFFSFFVIFFSSLSNRQPNRLTTAKPILFGLMTGYPILFGLTMSFALSGFWTNVGNPTVYPPGKLPTLLTVKQILI
jgi:hypothetical protein